MRKEIMATDSDQNRSRNFHVLDALRGIAAAVVLTRHAPAFFGTGLFPNSSLGVDLFFVMSGFVIAHAYDRRLSAGLGSLAFLRIRLIRLYPLYFLGTLIGASVALSTIVIGVRSNQTGLQWQSGQLALSFVLSLLMIPSPTVSPSVDSLYPLNAVAWSLAFEIIINMLFAATHRFWTFRSMLVVMALSAIALSYFAFSIGEVDLGWNWKTLLPGLARVFYSFPAGVLIYRYWKRTDLQIELPFMVPLVVTIGIFLLGLPLGERLGFSLLAIFVLFPLVTIMAAQADVPRSIVPATLFLGVTSYAVYALHRPVLSVVNGIAQVLHVDLARFAPASCLPFLVILLGLCWVVDLLFDQPVRHALSGLGRSRAVGKPETCDTTR